MRINVDTVHGNAVCHLGLLLRGDPAKVDREAAGKIVADGLDALASAAFDGQLVAHYRDREKSIIEACERVADGGQYRADIVSAIETIRHGRDEALAALTAKDADVVEMRRQRDVLGKAIADAALKAGIYNGEVPLTGPHLLLLLDDMVAVNS
jgi:hypothetical protein